MQSHAFPMMPCISAAHHFYGEPNLKIVDALEQIYNIIDSRYRSRKPLIVTTNLTLDDIRHPQDTAHARIYDRLLEMCVPVSCIGVSFRKETTQEKLERLKELIG